MVLATGLFADTGEAGGATTSAPRHVYVVGDSLSVGMRSAGLEVDLEALGWSVTKTQATVGIGVSSSLSRVRADAGAVSAADAIVVELGTNHCSFSGSGWCESAAAFVRAIQEMVMTIRSLNADARIYWVNIYSSKGSAYRAMNDAIALESVASGYTVIDWAGEVTSHRDEYSFDRSLGVHPTGDGYGAMASFVSSQVAAVGSPVGTLDGATPWQGGARVTGWAFEPDVAGSALVVTTVDGVLKGGFAADRSRPDVAAAIPGQGATHGFDAVVEAESGTHLVCAIAKNTAGGGTDTELGCDTVVVGSPFGTVDRVRAGRGTIRVAGWTVDPDTSEPVAVHVYVDGDGSAHEAAARRTDVATAFPTAGERHGYRISRKARPGPHQVCVYGIDATDPAVHTELGCRAVDVSSRRSRATRSAKAHDARRSPGHGREAAA